jgi:hypothetical protein
MARSALIKMLNNITSSFIWFFTIEPQGGAVEGGFITGYCPGFYVVILFKNPA